MIAFYILCLCATVITADGSLIKSCFSISPQTPVVEVGSRVTAYCVMNQTCMLEENQSIKSDELYWKMNSDTIARSQYTTINETASRVNFQLNSASENQNSASENLLSCNTNIHGQIKTTLVGMFIRSGFPPEKPENLSCICYNREKLTCTWNPGRPTIIETTYTLNQTWKGMEEDYSPELKQNNSYKAARARGRSSTLSKNDFLQIPSGYRKEEKRHACVSDKKDSCTLIYPDFQLYIDTTFQVVAKNELGTAESDELRVDIIEILKPNPPEIANVLSFAPLQKALKIEWKNPLKDPFKFKYNIRYRRKESTEWEQVPPSDIEKTRNSYTLQDLQPYTSYIISLRCKLETDKGFWSDWSKEYEAMTPESPPSRSPEFWRKIGDQDSHGNRIVWLMWKDLGSYANGKILGYNITIETATHFFGTFSTNNTVYNLTVPKDALKISLVAYNSYNVSAQSIVFVPDARHRVTLPSEIEVKAFPKDGKLWVEWTSPNKWVMGYVIEWCANQDSQGCAMQWQREPSTVNGSFLRGDLEPFVYYVIKVYPLYRDGIDRPRYVANYLEQGIPEEGPVVNYKSVEKSKAVIVWQPVPLEKQGGFITNYTLKYEAKNGSVKSVTLDAKQTEYTMTSLTGNTVYRVIVTANTEKGGRDSLPFTFSTNKFDTGEVEAIVVSSCIGFLLLVLIGGILLCNKRDLIKKHIWPNVPDPSKSNIAQWSPQTPTRHEPKSHPFQDGSFTDVSVVEITADDEKSSYGKQDLKSVDMIKKNTSEGLSSGIGGSSCLSSPQLSISDSDEVESGQNTSSTIQYSTVIISGYRGQQPTAVTLPTFSRSESTQPLLESEERPDEQQVLEIPNQYFKQNCTQEDSTGRLQALQQENPCHIHEPGQSQHLGRLGHATDVEDFNAGQIVNFEGQPASSEDFNAGQIVNFEGQPASAEMDSDSTEINSYLPQTVRRGGYLPQ